MIEFNDKHLDMMSLALRPDTRLITLEGTVRSSKTVVAIQAFFYRVYQSKSELHLIAGRDFDTINNNILSNEMGLLKQFPRHCKLCKDRIGGFYVRLQSDNGIKKILIVGYNDKTKWSKILGSSIENIFVDEVNVANRQFIDECFSRQTSFDYPLTIWTLNGDNPTHWVYTDYINRCKILGTAPISIQAEMARYDKTANWFYMHWTMQDNPVMTPSKIAGAESIYPKGSYYHTIKILGERGAPGSMIYLDYIDESKLIKAVDISKYHEFGIGVDIGASRAKNSYTLVGFSYDFSNAAIIDKLTFSQLGYKQKTEQLAQFVKKWQDKGLTIRYITVDNAELNYIEDLTADFRKLGLPPVYACDKATIKQRIDLVILLMARGKLVFNDTEEGKNALQAFKSARWVEGKEGKEREDNNDWYNDVMDSIEYGLTRHMGRLLRSIKQEEGGNVI